MTRRRGFTLIEILASLALLSLVVAGCLPFLTAGAVSTQQEQGFSIAHLGMVADDLLDENADVPLELDQIPKAPEFLELDHLAGEDTVHLRVSVLESDDELVTHRWIRFAHRDSVVFRWSPLPDPVEPEESP